MLATITSNISHTWLAYTHQLIASMLQQSAPPELYRWIYGLMQRHHLTEGTTISPERESKELKTDVPCLSVAHSSSNREVLHHDHRRFVCSVISGVDVFAKNLSTRSWLCNATSSQVLDMIDHARKQTHV